MAFMMPVMKKNYNIYSHKQQRRTASEPDGAGRKSSQVSRESAGTHPHSRRRVKSEGPSLSTSPAAVISGAETMTTALAIKSSSKPIGMRRGRGSAPILSAPSSSLHPNCHMTGPSTAPTGDPAPISIMSSPSRSTSSSSTSSGSGSTAALGRFHTKLIARLRRSLRLNIKDPEPTAT